MKKIYISGKISGLDADFVREKFNGSEWDLIIKNKPFENPIHIRPLFGIDKWIFHLIADIWQLLKCDAILLQPDWIDSRGSKIEVIVAILTGKQIIIEK
jgi:hypothetical protein